MEPEIVGALVAAAASATVAFMSLLSSRKATRVATRAEETAKRSEQVRIKATEAGEQLLCANGEVLIAGGSLEGWLRVRPDKSPTLTLEETETYFAPIAKAASEMLRLSYCTAMYLTPEIQDGVDRLLRPIFAGGVKLADWSDFMRRLRDQHLAIADLFRETYLDPIL